MTRYLRLHSHRTARLSLILGVATAGLIVGGSALAQGMGTAGSGGVAEPPPRATGSPGVDTRVNAHAEKSPAGAAPGSGATTGTAGKAASGTNGTMGTKGRAGTMATPTGAMQGAGAAASSTSSTSGGTNTMR